MDLSQILFCLFFQVSQGTTDMIDLIQFNNTLQARRHAILGEVETVYSNNKTCRGRIVGRLKEDDSERAKDFDEKHIRRAVERQDAQTQSHTPADIATDSKPHDVQPIGERITQTRKK